MHICKRMDFPPSLYPSPADAWQPLELGIVNLKTHSLRNQTGRGGGVGKRERIPMCLLFQTK